MARDFEDWDNRPGEDADHLRSVARSPNMAPPRVARIEREVDLRRKRRNCAIFFAACIAVGIVLFRWFLR